MIKQIEFYFDFISPYAYLAHKKIVKLQQIKKIDFIYRPILLGGLHNQLGIIAPGLIEIKKKFMIHDCKMVAKKFDINFKFNENFPINSLYLMRGLLTIESEKKFNYIDKFYEAYWAKNLNLKDQNTIKIILEDMGIDHKQFLDDIELEKIKTKLKELTNLAEKKNIFGAPTFVANNKIFWGQDRLEYAIDEALAT